MCWRLDACVVPVEVVLCPLLLTAERVCVVLLALSKRTSLLNTGCNLPVELTVGSSTAKLSACACVATHDQLVTAKGRACNSIAQSALQDAQIAGT